MVVPIAYVLGVGGIGDGELAVGASVVFPHMFMFFFAALGGPIVMLLILGDEWAGSAEFSTGGTK
jgi:hypothetical protein